MVARKDLNSSFLGRRRLTSGIPPRNRVIHDRITKFQERLSRHEWRGARDAGPDYGPASMTRLSKLVSQLLVVANVTLAHVPVQPVITVRTAPAGMLTTTDV